LLIRQPGLRLVPGQLESRRNIVHFFHDYEREYGEQLTRYVCRIGLRCKRDIAGIVLNRFGHAFINPNRDSFSVSTVNQAPWMPFATVPSAESASLTAI